MRTISRSTQFNKDYKRELKGRYRSALSSRLPDLISLLLDDEPLPANAADHALVGEYIGYRDCHVRPDLLLIYRKLDPYILELVRLGSHSELKF